MDRDRFDALAKLLATTGSRRAALAVLLAGGLLGHDPDALAKSRRGKGKRKHRGADRGERQRGGLAAEDRGKRRKRRKKHRRQDHDGEQTPAEPTGVCCDDTRPCAPPGPGSVRSGCDFAEQAFAGQDHQGAIFRQIDGVGAAFDNTDNRGSIFAAACLRFATFRGAKLAGAIWRDACLFAADFTGAELDVEAAAFGGAVLCATILPDGTRSDRDCGRAAAFPCCLPPPGGGGVGGGPSSCTGPRDCPDKACQSKTCTNRSCVYTPVADGPSPNGLCASHCCRGACCPPGIPSCNPSGQCCAPNCAGKQCGPDGCGTGGTCGACPAHLACESDGPRRGICLCTDQSCPPGCCDDSSRTCQPGNTTQACGTGGGRCQSCPAGFACSQGRCVCTSSQQCASGQACVDGRCVCTPQSCPHGCCTGGPGNPGECQPGNTTQACGTGSGACKACSAGQGCSQGRCVCNAQSCPTGCCAADGACQPGTAHDNCGAGGIECGRCGVLNGVQEQCFEGECSICTLDDCKSVFGPHTCCDAKTNGCHPGTTDRNCGSDSGTCVACPADQRCIEGRCRCTPQSCAAGQACVDGHCVCTAQSCPHGCCANGAGNPGTCRPGNRIDACGTSGVRCASCSERQTCQGGQCVGCNGNCTCAGQTVCTNAGAPHVVCGGQGGGACVCVNSRTGQPFCLGFEAKDHVCETDADCQSVFPGGVCVDHTTKPGIAEFCFNSHPYCVGPCP